MKSKRGYPRQEDGSCESRKAGSNRQLESVFFFLSAVGTTISLLQK